MTVQLLTEHDLEFLTLRGGCIDLSKPTHVKTPHCVKSHITAQIFLLLGPYHNYSEIEIILMFFLLFTRFRNFGPFKVRFSDAKEFTIKSNNISATVSACDGTLKVILSLSFSL